MKRLGALLLVVAAVVVGILVGRIWSDTDTSPAATSPSSTQAQTDLAVLSATVQRVDDPETCGGFGVCLLVTVANWGPVDVTLNDGCGTPSFGDPQPWAPYAADRVLAAGETVTYRAGYPGLEEHLPATFTLVCEIDAADGIAEPNETNNVYTTDVTLS